MTREVYSIKKTTTRGRCRIPHPLMAHMLYSLEGHLSTGSFRWFGALQALKVKEPLYVACSAWLRSLARESSSAMTCPSFEAAKYASKGRKMIEAKETTEFLDLGDTVGVQQFKIPQCSMELD